MISIIDYEAGNLTSVSRALSHLGHDHVITRDPDVIANAERVIFPGVGAAASAMESLKRFGLDEAIHAYVKTGRPFMGICLGTQIILEHSEEGDIPCVGLLPGTCRRFPENLVEDDGRPLKIPHMGWNGLHVKRPHFLFEGMKSDDFFYFVHGYFTEPDDGLVLAETDYGVTFASVIGRDNVVACQFHPEKSGRPGLRILDRFARWIP